MRLFVALLLAAAAWPTLAQTVIDRAQKDDLVFMSDTDPAMSKAFARARATLDSFLELAKSRTPEYTSFSLKVGIADKGNTEYFWVNSFEQKADGTFEGEIGNEPRMVKTVKLGQRYAFPRGHIVDWTYIDRQQRRMVGNFTLCALLTKESKQDAEATKRRFKLDCDWLQ